MKNTFSVTIVETYRRTVDIKAKSKDDALDVVQDMIASGEIDLPCDGKKYEYENELY